MAEVHSVLKTELASESVLFFMLESLLLLQQLKKKKVNDVLLESIKLVQDAV